MLFTTYQPFLEQKAKVMLAKAGDENTALFHKAMRARITHNRVNYIINEESSWVDTKEGVQEAFLYYYHKFSLSCDSLLLGANYFSTKITFERSGGCMSCVLMERAGKLWSS